MTKPTLLVLAAGMGSRYGGLKQIDAFGPSGETIIDYSVYDAKRAGFGKVVFVIRHEFEEAFRRSVGDRYAGEIAVDYAYQELDALPPGCTVPPGRVKPWGTGHAILVARDVIDTPFAVINADDFYGAAGFAAAADYLRTARDGAMADYCMVGYRLANTLSEHGTVSRGICTCDPDGCLSDVVETHGIGRQADGGIVSDPAEGAGEKVPRTGDEVVSMNLWGFTPSIFEHLAAQFSEFLAARSGEAKSEFYIPSAVNELIRSGKARARVLTCDAQWFGVTYREDKAPVEQSIRELVASGAYPAPLWPNQATAGRPNDEA